MKRTDAGGPASPNKFALAMDMLIYWLTQDCFIQREKTYRLTDSKHRSPRTHRTRPHEATSHKAYG